MSKSKFFAMVAVVFLLSFAISFAANQNKYPSVLLQLQIGQTQFVLDKSSVEKASLIYEEKNHYQGLDITLRPDTAKKIKAVTEKNIGGILTLIFNERVISRPIIQSPLGPHFQITGMTEQEAKLFLQVLQH